MILDAAVRVQVTQLAVGALAPGIVASIRPLNGPGGPAQSPGHLTQQTLTNHRNIHRKTMRTGSWACHLISSSGVVPVDWEAAAVSERGIASGNVVAQDDEEGVED